MHEKLKGTAREACAEITAMLEELRAVASVMNRAGQLASRLQHDAQDMELDPDANRDHVSFLDGNLLQHVGFLNTTAAETVMLIRRSTRSLMDVRKSCDEIHTGVFEARIAAIKQRLAGPDAASRDTVVVAGEAKAPE